MLTRPILYPKAYGVFIALAAMDVLLTWAILSLGGVEVNKVAAWFFETGGVTGAAFFKFATVYVVLLTCEFAGRHKDGILGRSLVQWAVLINIVPVTVAIVELTGYRLML